MSFLGYFPKALPWANMYRAFSAQNAGRPMTRYREKVMLA
jgi:hypothetical protein